MGRIKNLGQEVETFPLIVVQDLDKKKKHEQKNKAGVLTADVMSNARASTFGILTFTVQSYHCTDPRWIIRRCVCMCYWDAYQ